MVNPSGSPSNVLPASVQSEVHRQARHFRPALFMGIYVGAFMIIILFAGLVAANRIHSLEPYALERNVISYGALALLMLFPVMRFFTRPLHMYVSAMTSWVMFSIAYNAAGLYFHNLFDVLRTPLEVFSEGAVGYGLLAVVVWVAAMALHARKHPLARRRRPNNPFHPR
jgi:hypothetical protein